MDTGHTTCCTSHRLRLLRVRICRLLIIRAKVQTCHRLICLLACLLACLLCFARGSFLARSASSSFGFRAARRPHGYYDGRLPCGEGPGPSSRHAGGARSALRGTVRCHPGLCGAPRRLGPRLNPGAAAARGPSCRHRRLSLVPTLCSARLCGPLWVRASARPHPPPRPDGGLRQRADLHGDVLLHLGWSLRRWRTRSRIFGVQHRHRLHRLRPSNVASAAAAAAASTLATLSTWHGTAASATFATAPAAFATAATFATAPAASAITTTFATAPAASAITTAIPALATLAPAGSTAQTGSAWLGARGTERNCSPAVPSAAGLCARPPAWRPPDGVRTAQLLGTRASGLRRHAQACSSKARTRSQSCTPAAGVLFEQRDRMPAPAQANGKDWRRATGQQ